LSVDPGSPSNPYLLAGQVLVVQRDLTHRFRAMACDIAFRVIDPDADVESAFLVAHAVFEEVERTCTRFVATSPLMRANGAPQDWHVVPAPLFEAVAEAARAHAETGGLFDPRVLRTLEAYGYDRSLPFASGDVATDPRAETGASVPSARGPWQPGLDRDSSAVRLGPDPIDLGGIGKGLAVRWAAERLGASGRSVLVEAGGDCHLAGPGPDGDGWKVGVEDPFGGPAPLAVLTLEDLACATSSVRLRRWRVGQEQVHHLIDPTSGRPGGAGLAAVTVVGPDAAWAEVWSKSLFLSGADGIAALAEDRQLDALWVRDDGTLHATPGMAERVVWRVDG
jgi:thiamine biosynthesis lipoprotein